MSQNRLEYLKEPIHGVLDGLVMRLNCNKTQSMTINRSWTYFPPLLNVFIGNIVLTSQKLKFLVLYFES